METETTDGRRPLLRRVIAAIAMLATLIAFGGAVQAAAPTSATAVTRAVDCNAFFQAAERARRQGNFELAAAFEEQRGQCERDREREAEEEAEEHPLV